MKMQFTAGRKTVSVYPAAAPGRPIVYLNTYEEEEERIYRELQAEDSCPDFTLVAVTGLEWNQDMVPWDIPPVFARDSAYTGGADAYLRLLVEEIIPEAESRLPGKPSWRGVAGYSLAGLFAVYSLYQTDAFQRAASMSGSLWFPEFREYAFSNEMKGKTEHVYLSLGDRECRTGNPYLRTVQERTEEIAALYRGKGINTVFQLNPGGHGRNTVRRTAAGIRWILQAENVKEAE